MRAKHKRVRRDLEHKISRAVVDVAIERQAGTIAIGDVRDIAEGLSRIKPSQVVYHATSIHDLEGLQWN